MSARILDGAVCGKDIRAEIAAKVQLLGYKLGLAVLLVGDDPASHIYVKSKGRAAFEVGFESSVNIQPATTSEGALLGVIRDYNKNPAIHGYIVQLPLPTHVNLEAIVSAIDPKKDVDGFHPENQGLLLRGIPRFIPATPRGIIELLRRNGISSRGKHVVILGRSSIVGRPLAATFLMKGEMGDATVTVAHSQTKSLADVCREADIVVAALGQARFVTRDFIKPGAVVIDVGINRVGGKICGDVDFDSVKDVASAITPVPGGVGPMTIAMLLQNTLDVVSRK